MLLNTSISNITELLFYSGGSLSLNHVYSLKVESGKLKYNDLTIDLEPLSSSSLTEYASFLGISLDTVLSFFGIDPNNPYVENYKINQIKYDEDYFGVNVSNQLTLDNSKLPAKTSNIHR